MKIFGHGAQAKQWRRDTIYYPEKRPGFVAWTTAFDYGNGSIGLSFKETLQAPNLNYAPPKLEMGEAVGAPVSYCSVECGSESQESFRVYMISHDNGKTFAETGRCQLEEGSFCNIGFPDGRILGMDVPRINPDRTGWCDWIEVRESLDGGSTWSPVTRLLEGCAPYLWRVRRLHDGTVLVLASLYGTPWGPEKLRATRNTMLPGESYLSKIQTFFLTTTDGYTFTGPHYVLPGIGAHEYDVVECNDGSLLFIAGDVQATPVARQLVTRKNGQFINGTLYGIRRGAPADPTRDPQGGFVPETMVMLPSGVIVGSRRNKPYSCSNDLGENWYEIDGLPESLYQPFLMQMPDGSIANFGHFGGDISFGQADMYIGADFFRLEDQLPRSCSLTLERCLSHDGSHYENRFKAQLCAGDEPVEGETLTFRFVPVWNADGTVNNTPQEKAALQIPCITGPDGYAEVHAEAFDDCGDIHFSYNVDVAYYPSEGSRYCACVGPMMCVAALTPHRRRRYPYRAYFAEGTLFLSPDLLEQFPTAISLLEGCIKRTDGLLPEGLLPPALVSELIESRVLDQKESALYWRPSVHAPFPLNDVLPMAEGDWYI